MLKQTCSDFDWNQVYELYSFNPNHLFAVCRRMVRGRTTLGWTTTCTSISKRSHLQTLVIHNQNYYAFALILLIKIVL